MLEELAAAVLAAHEAEAVPAPGRLHDSVFIWASDALDTSLPPSSASWNTHPAAAVAV